MPLRVGFDLDGTVADMYSALHREALTLFGEEGLRKAGAEKAGVDRANAAIKTLENKAADRSAKPEDDVTTNETMQELHLTARQQSQLWDHVKKIENFWSTLPELEPGIIARIAKAALAAPMGSDLPDDQAVDRRRAGADAVATLARSARLPVSERLRGAALARQDRRRARARRLRRRSPGELPRHRRRIASQGDPGVARPDLADVPAGAKRLGVQPVSTISEAMVLLERLDDVRNKPSLMRSVKKAFGRRLLIQPLGPSCRSRTCRFRQARVDASRRRGPLRRW